MNSSSQPSTSQVSMQKTPKRERERDDNVQMQSVKERRPRHSSSHNSNHVEEKEKEPESETDDDLSKKRSHMVVAKDAARKVDIKHRDVDEAEMKKLLAKFKEKKNEPAIIRPPMDEKVKILMDRVTKKAYPAKYARKEHWKTMMLAEEDAEFFKPSVGKKNSASVIIPDDTYEHVPKLHDVLKLDEEEVFLPHGNRQPFWAATMEPDDEDMKDTDPPISVGTDHVEQYHDKKLTLKTLKDTKLILDEWAALATLQKRDDVHFHPHLVFSNTVRSLVNVQSELKAHERSTPHRKNNTEEATQAEEDEVIAIFAREPPQKYIYDRLNPILSARERFEPPETTKNGASTPTPTLEAPS